MSKIYKIKIIKEVYSNGNFKILSATPMQAYNDLVLSQYMTISLKGELSFLIVNKEYDVELELVQEHKVYGGTYKILSCPSLVALDLDNLTLEQSREILEDITTPQQTSYILDAYPDFIKIVLAEGKDAIDVNKIYNVKEVKLSCYARLLNERYKYLHLLQAYKQYNIDISDCKLLYDKLINDETIIKKFNERPYMVLVECLGRSFKATDKLLMELRPELEESEQRCEFMMLDILSRNESDGSSRLDANILFQVAKEDYNMDNLLPLLKKVAIESELIYFDEKTMTLAKMSTYNGECLIADFIKSKISNPIIDDFEWEEFKEIKDGFLTEEQSNVLKTLCENNFVMLDAPAGCGKSSAMMALLQMLEEYGKTYTCLCPTGKSSAKLSEQTGRPSSTIHKACLSGTISTDFLICDEDSFLSIETMCMIINAIDNQNIKILLIGDMEQIQSLSCGRITRDIIESGIVPVCKLTKCFRFGEGGKATVSMKTRNGEFYLPQEELNNGRIVMGKKNDYEFIESNNSIEQICDVYQGLLNKGIKPNDICVIIPQNVGNIGTYEVNNALQLVANPPKVNQETVVNKIYGRNKTYEVTFRQGDLCMNTKNNYHIMNEEEYNQLTEDDMLSKEDVATHSVFNGQIGKVLSIEKNIMKIMFDQEILVFDKSDSKNLLLAFSSNPFKYQGSQCKYIINVVLSCHERMLNKQLLYTALTRASEKVIEIGEVSAIKKAITTIEGANRNTWLLDLLKGEENE